MTKNKKASEIAKDVGLKSLKQVSDMINKPVPTLINWHKNNPILFKAVVLGCAEIERDKDQKD